MSPFLSVRSICLFLCHFRYLHTNIFPHFLVAYFAAARGWLPLPLLEPLLPQIMADKAAAAAALARKSNLAAA